MKIEHVAYMMAEPAATAAWYGQHLGLKVVRKMDVPPFTHFLGDDSGQIMLEIYNNTKVKVPDYASNDPLLLHLAFVSAAPKADRERLLKAGATIAADIVTTPDGDELLMMRDPWGFPIQFCKRTNRMI